MHYTSETDNAIRILMYLAVNGNERVTTNELSKHTGYSYSALVKLLRKLKRNTKWIDSSDGKAGGHLFKGNVEKITVYAVQRAANDEFDLSRAVRKRKDVLCEMYSIFEENTREYFSKITLADLIKKQQEEEQRLIAEEATAKQEENAGVAELEKRLEIITAQYEEKLRKLETEQESMHAAYADTYKKLKRIMNTVNAADVKSS